MILREPSSWSKDNSAILRQFLDSGTGQLFLAHLAAARPGLLTDSNDVNRVALRASDAAGWEGAISCALSLAELPKENLLERETYPNLDDDAQWGEKK